VNQINYKVVETKRKQDAFIAVCQECGQHFDNDIPAFTLSQSVASHRRGTGHGKFIYYEMENLDG
jgi:hypothetical protein